MPIEGFVGYKRREYCNDVKCRVQELMNQKGEDSGDCGKLREICKNNCLHSTYEFHHWLIEKGYELVRPEKTGK